MQIEKKFLFLFMFTIVSLLTLSFTKVMPANSHEHLTSTDEIERARNFTLKFAQMGYDLINEKKELEDELASLHNPQIAPIKKFSPSRLLTKPQWLQIKKIGELEKIFESEFIGPITQNCNFLIFDSIDIKTFLKELIFLENKISIFCDHAELPATKIGLQRDISAILNNIYKMISKIEIEAYRPSKNITTLTKIKNVFWGTSFSYETFPLILNFGVSTVKLISLMASYFTFCGFLRAFTRLYEGGLSGGEAQAEIQNIFMEFLNQNNINQNQYRMISLGCTVAFIIDALGQPLIKVYQSLQKDNYEVYKKHLEAEIKRKQTLLKKTFITHNINFSDIVGYEKEKKTLKPITEALLNPIKFRCFEAEIPKGLLLIGPPGSGKTLFARAIASETNCACWSICGADLFGDDEKSTINKIDELFYIAETFAPSIIVIDEIDFIGSRQNNSDTSNTEKAQALAKLLTKLSGFNAKNPYKPVFVIATANYPENIDPALMRSGRFDLHLALRLPNSSERKILLERQLQSILCSEAYRNTIDLDHLAKLTEGCSFADIVNIVNKARLQSGIRKEKIPFMKNFEHAINKIKNEKSSTRRK